MVRDVRTERRCSRTGCTRAAVATLTYVYRDSTAVVGPLATSVEPHSYDLCAEHAGRLTAPRGWDVVRADGELVAPPVVDDLTLLAEAVREATPEPVGTAPPTADGHAADGATSPASARRGHLRVLPRRDTD